MDGPIDGHGVQRVGGALERLFVQSAVAGSIHGAELHRRRFHSLRALRGANDSPAESGSGQVWGRLREVGETVAATADR